MSVREKPLDQTLYEDAERRRKEHAVKKAELDRTRDMPKEKQYKNENSDKYVLRKFVKEFELVKQEVLGENAEEDKLLDMETTMRVLLMLGFLPQNKGPEGIDQKAIQDLWTIAKAEDNHGISFDTLKSILLNVIGIKLPEREKVIEDAEEQPKPTEEQPVDGEEAAEKPKPEYDLSKLASFEEGVFYLRKGCHSKLFTLLKCLYVHRVQYVGLFAAKKTSKDYVDPSSYL